MTGREKRLMTLSKKFSFLDKDGEKLFGEDDSINASPFNK